MKRGKPLARRTPLKVSGLQGGTLSRSGQLKPRSDRRRAVMVDRVALVVRLLNEAPRCQIRAECDGAPAVDVHERLKRSRGGNILDPVQAHMVTACRRCHDWTEREVAAATAARMLLPSWHVCPPVGPC